MPLKITLRNVRIFPLHNLVLYDYCSLFLREATYIGKQNEEHH